MSWKKSMGFTLIELVIVIAILAILALIALPSYSRYVRRSHRVDGQDLLLRVAAAEESYKMGSNKYADTTGVTTLPPNGLGFSSLSSEQGYYTVAVAKADGPPPTFTAIVTPIGAQANDECGALSIDQTGSKRYGVGPPGDQSNGKCW